MIRKPSKEWEEYVVRLIGIKNKSNREVLCTDCWMILNYEQRGKHSSRFPDHKNNILTSSQFATEIQFYHIACINNKVIEKEKGKMLIIQPCLFDPKRGANHMRMIEEICREMHCDLNCNQTGMSSMYNYSIGQTLPSQSKATSTKITKIVDNVQSMVSSLSQFEMDAYNHMYYSFNNFGSYQNTNYSIENISTQSKKTRNPSEWNCLSSNPSSDMTIPMSIQNYITPFTSPSLISNTTSLADFKQAKWDLNSPQNDKEDWFQTDSIQNLNTLCENIGNLPDITDS